MEFELREVQCLFIRKGKLKFLYQNPRPKDHPQTYSLVKSYKIKEEAFSTKENNTLSRIICETN